MSDLEHLLRHALQGVCDELAPLAPQSSALAYASGILVALAITPNRKRPQPGRSRGRPRADPATIVAAYLSGKTIEDTATACGVSVVTVRAALNREGVPARGYGPQRGADRLPRIMDLRAQGMSGSEIGRELGVTRQRVCQLVKRGGMTEQFAERPFKPEELAALVAYRNGQTLGLTAKALDVTHTTAKCYLERAGIPLRGEGGRYAAKVAADAKAAQIAACYARGDTTTQIAKTFGLTSQTQVYRYLARVGVKPDRAVTKGL